MSPARISIPRRFRIQLLFYAFLLTALVGGLALATGGPLRAGGLPLQADGPVTFGNGAGIQMVDPDGSNRMPYWIDLSLDEVIFALYPLTDSDLSARYGEQDWNDPVKVDLSGLDPQVQWTEAVGPDQSYDVRFATLPDDVPPGLYAIEAVVPGGRAVVPMVYGRVGLIAKEEADGDLLIWATTLQNGAPVPTMTVQLYDDAGGIIAAAVTDASGIVRLTPGDAVPHYAVGRTDTEIALVGFDYDWRTWTGAADWSPDQLHESYLYTDRPIYRPGQTVYMNAFVRRIRPDGYSLPDTGAEVRVTLRDSRNNVIVDRPLSLDGQGAVSAEFLLGQEPPLGRYTLELTVAGEVSYQTFQVESYVKPEYAVAVTVPDTPLITGDPLPITVAADYFFGQPVVDAEVQLTVSRHRTDWWYGYWWWDSGGEYFPEGPVTTLTGRTGADGRWQTTYTPEPTEGANWRYQFSAVVTDLGGRAIESRATAAVYWNTFDLRVATPRYGYGVDENIDARITAVDHAGAPVAGRSVNWSVLEDDGSGQKVVRTGTGATGEDGVALVEIGTLPQGWYRLETRSTDARSRTVSAYTWLWVMGDENRWWYTTSQELKLQLDRDSYASGDTAQLLIESRVTGVGLLTIQRNEIIEERIVPIDGPVTVVDLPVDARHAPNAHLTFHLFKPVADAGGGSAQNREASLLTARTELVAPAVEKRLAVEVTTDETAYRPGETAAVTIKLRDHAGDPAAGRVSLALVDEAIFALAEDQTDPIFDRFYGPRSDQVSTYQSYVRDPYYYRWEPTTVVDPQPTATAPIEGDPPTEDGDGGEDGVQVRREFRDTAYWNPAVEIGASGETVIQVPLPDNLTTWRVIVKAITAETQVGETTGSLLVTQEIIARPQLPRFAVLGDRFQAGVVGQNYSGAAADGTVSLESDGLVALDGATQSMTIPDGGATRADWTVVAAEVGTAQILSTLQTDRGADAVELPLPVKPFAVPEQQSYAGMANPEAVETFTMPLNAVNEASALTLRLSPSIALGVIDGLDQLIDYPYGCVEQTMSRVLPAAMADKVYRDLGIDNPRAAEMPSILGQGLQKLYGFQHSSGGWGWFYDDEGGVYTSAYVLLGLTTIQQNGVMVDQAVIDRGFEFLAQKLPEVTHPGYRTYILYVMANDGRGDPAATRALIGRADQLDPGSLALLALTLDRLGDADAARSLLEPLLARAVETPATIHWPSARDNWDQVDWRMMNSTDKNTALALSALTRLTPDDPRGVKAVRWLMEHRRNGGWSNTQSTAFAVLALLDYLKSSNELTADYAYTVMLNDAVVAQGAVTPATAAQPIPPVVIPGSAMRHGNNTLRIEHDGGAISAAQLLSRDAGASPLYYSGTLRKLLHFSEFQPVAADGSLIDITRSYALVEGAPQGAGVYSVGDVVEVTLAVDLADERSYLLIQDPVPAGFEVLQERVNPFAWGAPWEAFFWHDWGYNRKDIRDDRVDFFITNGWSGRHVLTYRMRAVIPGEFSVPPAEAFPMYADDLWGRSGSDRVSIAPDGLTVRPALAGDFDGSCRISDFDLQLVAAAWPGSAPDRDVVADGRIDLRDVASVGMRRGADCLADTQLPGTVAAERLVTWTVEDGVVGRPIAVTLRKASAAPLQGLALQVDFDPVHLRAAEVIWAHQEAVLPLGPTMDNRAGKLLFGAYDLPADLPAGAKLATIIFTGRAVGAAHLSSTTGQAVDGAGNVLAARADGELSVAVSGEELFLPFVANR